MRKSYVMNDGKIALLNTETDECIQDNAWINGEQQNRGTNLMVHKTKGGRLIFYEFNWTHWQGEHCNITILDEETIGVQKWVLEHYTWFNENELKRLEELGIKVEETA